MESGVFLFRPEYQTVLKVFDGSSRYSIPVFQRQYSWEAEQVNDLFEDIYSAFKRNDSYYFLGSIILTGGSDGSYEVIDGQQRLTTLTILFCVLRDMYFKNDNKIINRIRNLEDSKYRLHLVTHTENQNDFFQNIQKENALETFLKDEKKKSDNDGSKFIMAAITLDQCLKDKKWGETKNSMKDFVDYLLNSVGVISIVCSDKKGAVRLFRTLNDRGLDLTTSDLVKSFLYDESESPDEQNVIVEEWKTIENIVAETEDDNPDEMLTCYSYYLLESYQKEALYDRLEEKFKELRKHEKAEDIVYDIKSFAQIYKKVFDSKLKEIMPLWYLPNRLYWTSILATANEWQEEDYTKLSKLIRNTFYTYWIAGFTSAKLKQLTFDIIRLIKSGKALDVIRSTIDDKVLRDNIKKIASERLEGDVDKEAWIKAILLLAEYERTDDSKVEFVEMNGRLQLEHVLPTEWNKNPEWKKTWNDQEAKSWLHKMGNLTLLAGRKNASAGNEYFNIKKDVYLGKGKNKGITAFAITQELLTKSTWTTNEVSNRQTSLLKEIKKNLEIIS